MIRLWTLAIVVAGAIGLAILLSAPAEGIAIQGHFSDDNGSTFEDDIDAIAEAGITRGCNPPTNDHYCPTLDVDRGAMAAFLRRALNLPPSTTDHFTDDNSSIFQNDINAIAQAGITKGCNPPTNNRYCPTDNVTRGEMAAFLRRALDLPSVLLEIPLADHGAVVCEKDGQRCTITVDLVAGRPYRVEEGLFLVDPASQEEMGEFSSSATQFTLTVDGTSVTLDELGATTSSGVNIRNWRANLTFNAGNHTVVGRWRWAGDLVRTTIVEVRAS